MVASNTIQHALYVLADGDMTRAKTSLEDIIEGGQRWHHLEDDYFHLSKESLKTLAVKFNDISLLEYLLKELPYNFARDPRGRTSLHCACALGRLEAAKLLVRHGSALDDQVSLDGTPLNLAVREGHIGVAVQLVASLEHACYFGYTEVISRMLETEPKPIGHTARVALEQAVRWAPWTAVQLLLTAGAEAEHIRCNVLDELKRSKVGYSAGDHYRDAAEKISLLEQYGIDFEHIEMPKILPGPMYH